MTVWQRRHPLAASIQPRFRVRNLPLEATASDDARAAEVVEGLLAELRPRFVVIEATRWNRWIPLSSKLWTTVVARGPVFASAGDEDGTRSSFYQDIPEPIPRLFALDRMGPRIEIYELD
ncbi:MAG: hypothetical protein IPJ77_05510 [Planctomycetes bacterium]|nr:hypothetical protein [Planctomycetota bacterium]